jgi:hypothetical protein
MNLALLRVDGPEHVIEAMYRLLGIRPDVTYKQGDVMRNGRVHSSSGFSYTIVDAPNPVALVNGIREFLIECRRKNLQLSASVSAEIGLGVAVGDSQQFTACVDFSPSDMVLLGTLGFSLSVTAYPTSDEANVEPN